MKRKALIGVVATGIIIGITVSEITVSKNIINKTDAIGEMNDNSNLEKDDEKLEDDNNLGENSINNVSGEAENNEQTLLEGYEIFYKAQDFFYERNYEEASKLYNTITNKEALAKIEIFKEELDYYMSLYDFINKGQELYESGNYELARIPLYNVTGSNPSDKQIEITNDLLDKIEEKINENGEKEFTYDLAVEYLKLWFNYDENNIYEYAPIEILSDGSKRYLILVKDKRYPENDGYYYSVDEDGRVTGD